MNLWVEENYVDVSEGCRIGDTELYETFTPDEGELFRAFRKLPGRCISKVYVDEKAIGWVFQSRVSYCDSIDTYFREVWVTLHDGQAKQAVKYRAHELVSESGCEGSPNSALGSYVNCLPPAPKTS
jgi:hypothetical protein